MSSSQNLQPPSLILSDLLPACLHEFLPYTSLNPMQSQTFDALVHGDRSVVCSAPTGT